MTHELGPGRRFKSQLGEWYERDQVAAEVARAVAAERERCAKLCEVEECDFLARAIREGAR